MTIRSRETVYRIFWITHPDNPDVRIYGFQSRDRGFLSWICQAWYMSSYTCNAFQEVKNKVLSLVKDEDDLYAKKQLLKKANKNFIDHD